MTLAGNHNNPPIDNSVAEITTQLFSLVNQINDNTRQGHTRSYQNRLDFKMRHKDKRRYQTEERNEWEAADVQWCAE